MKLDRRQLGVLTAAGLGVSTLCAGVAFALTTGTSNEEPKRDTVPVGQLVDAPVSSSPSSSIEPPAVAADPIQKDTAVPNQPAPKTAQQPAPAAADDPTPSPSLPPAVQPPATETPAPPPPMTPPGNPNGAPNPVPAPTT